MVAKRRSRTVSSTLGQPAGVLTRDFYCRDTVEVAAISWESCSFAAHAMELPVGRLWKSKHTCPTTTRPAMHSAVARTATEPCSDLPARVRLSDPLAVLPQCGDRRERHRLRGADSRGRTAGRHCADAEAQESPATARSDARTGTALPGLCGGPKSGSLGFDPRETTVD